MRGQAHRRCELRDGLNSNWAESGRTITPVKVTHALVTEVYFSVYGEDQSGKPMLRPGNGGLRVLKVKKEVVLPSVRRVHGIVVFKLIQPVRFYPTKRRVAIVYVPHADLTSPVLIAQTSKPSLPTAVLIKLPSTAALGSSTLVGKPTPRSPRAKGQKIARSASHTYCRGALRGGRTARADKSWRTWRRGSGGWTRRTGGRGGRGS
jgi:hypothetical protein